MALYVVATPIGNLSDITLRAIEILKTVDFIACEDTRTTKRLLEHYNIATKTVSYHQHSGSVKIDKIINELEDGLSAALVTDAGTPGISDPGGQLVKAARQKQIEVIAIPGPSAVTAALSVSGLPTDSFLFLGFLPHKKGRQTAIKKIYNSYETVVCYESVHRIKKLLQEFIENGINHRIVVCRELTKKFETIYYGTAQEILNSLDSSQTKGEFVVMIPSKNYEK